MSPTTTMTKPAPAPVLPHRPTAWHRDHRLALVGVVFSTLLIVLAGALGPSVVTLTLGPRDGLLPPWYLPAGIVMPNEWLVSAMIWAAIIIGGAGLLIGMRALADGWLPRLKRLFVLGSGLTLATILVPPLTSADVLMYAAYGRLQVLGLDPYSIVPGQIFRIAYDPVLVRTERPWQDTPSVYGPITSWLQLAANKLGGTNMHDIVFWLQVFSAVPFIIVCALVIMLAQGDPQRQARAALFTIANPLLIWAVVAGAHNEAVSVMFAVGAMLLIRKTAFGAGLMIGLAGCAKISIGIWGIAILWSYRRQPKKALAFCAGAAIPMGLAYGLWQPAAFFQALRNGGYISVGSWVAPLYTLFAHIWTAQTGKIIVGVICYSLMIFIGWVLSRVVPWQAAPGTADGVDPQRDPLTTALRSALVLSTAWLITSMYTLSWYDLIAWVPLAVLAASKLDALFAIRSTALSLAYVPGRAIPFGPVLDVTAHRIRDTLSPTVQILVLVSVILWWKRPDRPELLPLRRRPSRAGTAPVGAAPVAVGLTAQSAVDEDPAAGTAAVVSRSARTDPARAPRSRRGSARRGAGG